MLSQLAPGSDSAGVLLLLLAALLLLAVVATLRAVSAAKYKHNGVSAALIDTCGMLAHCLILLCETTAAQATGFRGTEPWSPCCVHLFLVTSER
jgi:hypothetical protein